MSTPPTPQAISALLKRAGFDRSQRTGGRYGAPVVSEGYHVRKTTFAPPAAVDVRYRTSDSVAMAQLAARFPALVTVIATPDDTALTYQQEMLRRCAETIRAAGWVVDNKRFKLVVSPKEDTR